MPKTTKREETKRAAKIARAHANDLPQLEVRDVPRRSTPGNRAPARGLARYPWAITIFVLALALGTLALYLNHIGPFALPPTKTTAKPKASTTAVAKPTTTAAASPTATSAAGQTSNSGASPCTTNSIPDRITNTGAAPTSDEIKKINHNYSNPPAMSIDTNKIYCAGINTTQGLVIIELDPKNAPKTVNNFVYLAQHQFYDGLTFHRVVSGFVAQGGDPKGDGTGGPGYKFEDEPVKGEYTEGAVAMANSGPNTNGSQFFICFNGASSLPKSYNLFGKVVQGMDVVKKFQVGEPPAKPDVMNHVVVVAAS